MYDRPPLLALEHFVTTAETGSVRAAARRLNVSPSAVSHQISRLEEFLQIKLFVRHKSRLILTEVGRQYLARIEGTFTQIGEATREIAHQHKRQRLRVSSPPTFLIFWILPRFHLLAQACPEIEFEFAENLSIDRLRKDIDCGIEYRLKPGAADSCKIFDEQVAPVAAPQYARDMSIAGLEDLRHCTLIETRYREFSWSHVLKPFAWRETCRVLTLPYTYQTITSAILGHGIALANRRYVDHLVRAGSLVMPFDLNTGFYTPPAYYFTDMRPQQSSPAVQAFRDWLFAQVQEEKTGGGPGAGAEAGRRADPAPIHLRQG